MLIWHIIRNIIFNIEKNAANISVETYEILKKALVSYTC